MVSLESLITILIDCMRIYEHDVKIEPFHYSFFSLVSIMRFSLNRLTSFKFDILIKEGLILTFIMLFNAVIIGILLHNAGILKL